MTQEELIREVGKVIPNGVYSEEVIQLAFHMFQHGYNHAIDKACEWLETHILHAEADGYMTTDLFKQFKQFMEE